MTHDDIDSEALVARAGHGDPAAQEELLSRYRGRLRTRVALRLAAHIYRESSASDRRRDEGCE